MRRKSIHYLALCLCLLGCLSLLSLTACKGSKGNTPAESTTPTLTGLWQLHHIQIGDRGFLAEQMGQDMTIEFRKDGKMIVLSEQQTHKEELSYSYADGILSTKEDGKRLEVTELSAKRLMLTLKEEEGTVSMTYLRLK